MHPTLSLFAKRYADMEVQDEDEKRRLAVLPLNPSVGHYSRQLKLPPAMRALAKQAREGQRPFAMLASELRPEMRLMPAGRAQRSTGVAESAGGVPTVRLGAVA